MYDLSIIGAGPAGITAAIYAARKNIRFNVIGKELGGQVTYNLTVENYTGFQEISGAELVQKFNQHIDQFNFDFVEEEAVAVTSEEEGFKVATAGASYKVKSAIIASGTSPKKLNVAGEQEYRNRGISYCVTCDGPLFRERKVAVIGAGNHALYSAIQLESIASHVYVLNPETKLGGKQKLIEELEQSSRVTIINKARVLEITGDQLVNGLRYKQNSHARRLKVEGVFINIGYEPQTEFLKGLVDLNRQGEIIIDWQNRTSTKGIFAAGDCTNYPYKQIIVAAGQGASATLSAYKYLKGL
ncbi:MAG: NAD(P)/FAD-dependent oxidoreductase [Actinomycetota bacterium]